MNLTMRRRDFLRAASAALSLPALTFAQQPSGKGTGKRHLLRFAVASDGHFGQPNTDFKHFHEQMMTWLNEENAGRGLDCIVFNGDLIHDEPAFLPEVKTYYGRLEAPYYVTKGNHDRVSPEVWKQTWGYGQNHDFELGDFAFLLSSTANEAGEYLCADGQWLQDRLNKHKEKKWIFVFMHICQMKVTRNAVSCPGVTDLLETTDNVAAVFHGHDHDLDHVILSDGRAYLFDGHFGGNWGTNYHGYRIVEVDHNHGVQTYQCNPGAFYVNGMTLAG